MNKYIFRLNATSDVFLSFLWASSTCQFLAYLFVKKHKTAYLNRLNYDWINLLVLNIRWISRFSNFQEKKFLRSFFFKIMLHILKRKKKPLKQLVQILTLAKHEKLNQIQTALVHAKTPFLFCIKYSETSLKSISIR